MEDRTLRSERDSPSETRQGDRDDEADRRARREARQSLVHRPDPSRDGHRAHVDGERRDAVTKGAEADAPDLIDERFTRHRVGETAVLYDRLEQTTWVQADVDPADLVTSED